MSSVADPTPAPQPPAVTEPEGEFRPPSADASAIRLDSLRKVFGSGDDAVVAVDGVDLEIVRRVRHPVGPVGVRQDDRASTDRWV